VRVDRSRLEAFSDGVFAVAITLLALDLAVAGPYHGPLSHQLAEKWPAYVAYVVSFFTIGIIWVNHHALVQNIAVIDRMLLFLNLGLLAFVVAIPFATSTMADYLARGGQDAKVAAALYAAVFEGMSLGFTALFEWTLYEDGRTHRPVPEAARSAARLRFYIGQLPYLIAIGVAFISPPISFAICGLVAVYYIVERTPGPAAAPDGLPALQDPPASSGQQGDLDS
jgi:TMEM175 potassium channel family protein